MAPSTAPETMFDPEVIAELRRQFQEADRDGSGEIDAFEACTLFARSCEPSASEEEVRRTADGLRQQMDADRSGTISFNEYCFRFGRRYQMELNRRRRSSGIHASSGVRSRGSTANSASDADEELRQSREEIEREREALRRERERLELEKEREALRREREDLERERQRQAQSTSSANSAGSASSTRPQQDGDLPAGSRVRLHGLQAAPELNGRLATVVRFDSAAGRYTVDLDAPGGQKALRRENLAQLGCSTGFSESISTLATKAKTFLMNGFSKAQAWVATSGYEWWQILLGIAVVILIIAAWYQASSKHSGTRSGGRSSRRPRAGDVSDSYSDYREDTYSGSYDTYDDDVYGSGSYGGGGGLFSGGLMTYIIIGGLAYACWTGIIPVHRMNWFQLYMLWNFIQSTGLLGSGGGGYGGHGRRRRFF